MRRLPQRTARIRRPRSQRAGATLVETSLVMLMFILIVTGMLELGFVVFQKHVVSEAAREGARTAIVRGNLAEPEMNSWGPQTYTGTPDSGDEIAETIKPYTTGLSPNSTTIQMEWPDGNNKVGDRVKVTVSTTWEPFLTILFGSEQRTLSGVSTMLIAH